MIKVIGLIWMQPRHWKSLPKFKLIDDVIVNGYVIESGFVTDGASIPLGARNSFNPLGRAFPAALAHDHRCVSKFPRKEANKLFHRDLIDCGVSKTRSRMMLIGVEAYRIIMRVK
jgi:hypothetical protein